MFFPASHTVSIVFFILIKYFDAVSVSDRTTSGIYINGKDLKFHFSIRQLATTESKFLHMARKQVSGSKIKPGSQNPLRLSSLLEKLWFMDTVL